MIPEAVFFDIDGVLTDGAVYVDGFGREMKRISYEDIDAVFELKRAGVKVGFISGERSPFCRYVKRRFVPRYFLAGCKNKASAFQALLRRENMALSGTCYVGDSRKDAELLRYVPFSFAPRDADYRARAAAKIVVKAKRGCGVVRCVSDWVLKKRRGGTTNRKKGPL